MGPPGNTIHTLVCDRGNVTEFRGGSSRAQHKKASGASWPRFCSQPFMPRQAVPLRRARKQSAVYSSTGTCNMTPTDRRPCVVVVEEHEESRRAMQRALAANGYDVKSAGTVKEALYLIERYGCDLLVADIVLPDGTAVELLRSLADAGEAPKAIAMTDNTSFKDQAAAAKAGFG